MINLRSLRQDFRTMPSEELHELRELLVEAPVGGNKKTARLGISVVKNSVQECPSCMFNMSEGEGTVPCPFKRVGTIPCWHSSRDPEISVQFYRAKRWKND